MGGGTYNGDYDRDVDLDWDLGWGLTMVNSDRYLDWGFGLGTWRWDCTDLGLEGTGIGGSWD